MIEMLHILRIHASWLCQFLEPWRRTIQMFALQIQQHPKFICKTSRAAPTFGQAVENPLSQSLKERYEGHLSIIKIGNHQQ